MILNIVHIVELRLIMCHTPVNEITNYIKSQVPFDCKLKVSVTLVFINLQAKISNTNYTLSAMIYQKDKATALPKFAQALIAIHKVTDK